MIKCSTSFSGKVVCVETSLKLKILFPAGFWKMRSMRAMRQIFCRKKADCISRMGCDGWMGSIIDLSTKNRSHANVPLWRTGGQEHQTCQ